MSYEPEFSAHDLRELEDIADRNFEETSNDREFAEYCDRCDLEAAVASGFDPWAGLTIEEWAAANKYELVTT